MDLNKEDGGSRKFILITNNENNICQNITVPRIQKTIEILAIKRLLIFWNKPLFDYFGTGAWACLDTRAARLRLAADKPSHRLNRPTKNQT